MMHEDTICLKIENTIFIPVHSGKPHDTISKIGFKDNIISYFVISTSDNLTNIETLFFTEYVCLEH